MKNKKHLLKIIFFHCFFGISITGFTQLIGSGLAEDPSRIDNIPQNSSYFSNAKIQAYSDTLRIPFFEDFTGVVVPIDSITVSTADNLVKIHNNVLNAYPNGTAIFIGFVSYSSMTLSDTLSKKIWYIKNIGTNLYSIDSSASLTTPMKIFATNTIIQNAYWRLTTNNISLSPDSLKWVQNGNCYINNRFPINPVSYNAATFDGLKADGVPFNTVNVLAKGYSDNLTSLPINLSGLNASDNIYFSFYWQHNGVGDVPETDDYIELQFKNNSGVWITIQTINGNISAMTTFNFEIIQLTDPNYFFNNFQFRFRSYGRLSGPYDIWNIDYIYLDKNRTVLDGRIFDFTIGNTSASFLKNYTSMPYGQYFANKNNEIGVLDFTTNNLDRNLTTNQSLQGQCILTTSAGSYNYYYQDAAAGHSTGNNILTYQDICTLPTDSLQNQGLPMNVQVKYNLLGSTDTSNVLFAYNNTYINSTILWDYYAYDDGTPEWGVAANQSGAKVANKFTVNIKDTITDIDIYFTRSKGPNMDGRTILLSVWDHNYMLVSQQPVQVRYGGFIRYKLNSPFIVEAGNDVYVGYQQNFVDLLTIGYDKNYDHSDKVFFNLSGSSWNAYNLQPGYSTGSMMIRPVFSKNQILLPIEKEIEESENEVFLFPIPTDDILNIQGKVNTITIYSLTGINVLSKQFDVYDSKKYISTSTLPDGLYIIELKLNDNRLIRKTIIQHK